VQTKLERFSMPVFPQMYSWDWQRYMFRSRAGIRNGAGHNAMHARRYTGGSAR
jgi:hypothetical protein